MSENEEKKEILDKVYELGNKYEKEYGGCGQCVLAALTDVFDLKKDDVFKSLTGYAGGGGLLTDSGCGGYVAGILFLGLLKGRERENFQDPEEIRYHTYELSRKLHENFIDEYGSVICRCIQQKIFCRPYFLPDGDEFEKFEEAGAHTEKCPDVVGKAARWTAKIAIEENLISIGEENSD